MKKLFILFIFLLILPIVKAEFNSELASNYVSSQSSSDIITKSFQALALSSFDPTTADKITTQIKAAGNNCWSTLCQIKDTSLALMALHKRGESIDQSWLLSKQTASTSGKWYLQISTSAKGTCKTTIDTTGVSISIDAGLLSTSLCPTKTSKLDINSCIKSNLLSNPGKEITIDCSALGSTPIISLLNQEANVYYIVDKAIETQKLTLTINNGYFGAEKEDTLFANWFLSDINSKINSIIWLKKNTELNNVVHNSLMYLITSDEAYLSSLIKLQDSTAGSFGDTYNTAIATLALARSGKYNSALESARSFLGNKQLSDGSVENNLLNTAIVLYSYSITKPSEAAPLPPRKEEEKEPPEVCAVNGICDTDYGENQYNCPEDCEAEGEEEPEEKCGNNVCDENETETSCPEDCKAPAATKKSSAFLWIFLILLILIILGVVYYTQFYKKGKGLFKKKPPAQGPIYKPLIQHKPQPVTRIPIYTPKTTKKSKVEEELEKSLEEARKILKR